MPTGPTSDPSTRCATGTRRSPTTATCSRSRCRHRDGDPPRLRVAQRPNGAVEAARSQVRGGRDPREGRTVAAEVSDLGRAASRTVPYRRGTSSGRGPGSNTPRIRSRGAGSGSAGSRKRSTRCTPGPSRRLGNFLEADLPKGQAEIARRLASLEAYAGLRPDYAPGPSGSSVEANPPPRTPAEGASADAPPPAGEGGAR